MRPGGSDDLESTATFGVAAAPTVQEAAAMRKVYNLLARQDGQTMAEYATVLTVITLAVITAIGLLAGANANLITRVAGFLG
jgi:Flp pilus assembly pilin Flp